MNSHSGFVTIQKKTFRCNRCEFEYTSEMGMGTTLSFRVGSLQEEIHFCPKCAAEFIKANIGQMIEIPTTPGPALKSSS